MKRLMTFLAAVICLAGTAMAATVEPAVTVENADDLVKGYKGKVSFYFYTNKCQGDMRYNNPSACYAHIGLLTSASVDDQDIKYWGSGCNASSFGSTTELKGTSKGWNTWAFEFTDLYSFFGVTNPDEDITGIAMIFHDGNGASSKKGLSEYYRYVVIPLKKEPVCTYSVVMRSNWSIGWNGGCLNIWDNGYIHSCTLSYSENGVVAFTSYGGANKPKMIWTNSGYEEYASFDIIGAGGKILYTKDYDDVVTNGEVSFDLCSTEEGAYTLKNLKATDKGANVYAFSWDANLAYADYQLSIYDPDGTCIEIVETDKTQAEVNLGTCTKNGSYRAVLLGRDADKNVFGGGTSTNFAVMMKEVGQVKVRLLVPSDSEFDATNGVTFSWYGSDNVRYPVQMTQEGTSRWWTATADVKVSQFNFEFTSDLKTNEKAIAQHSGSRITNEDICCETGLLSYDYTDGGVKYYNYGLENADCDKQDHNYQIASSAITAKDGVATLSWTPKKDQAEYYWVTLYAGSHEYVADIKAEGLSAAYTHTGCGPITINEWAIQGYVEGEYTPILVANYTGTGSAEVDNPYAPKNVTIGAKNASNQYPITWDADERVPIYYIYARDAHYNTIIQGNFYTVGKEIEKDGNKYRIWTDAVLDAGSCLLKISACDKDKNMLSGDCEYPFTADAPTNLGQATIAVLISKDICYDITKGVWFCIEDGVNPAQWVKATQKTGTNIYEAKVTGISAYYFKLTVGNDEEANWSTADKVTFDKVKKQNANFELYKASGSFYLEEVTELKDHDYLPTDIQIVPNATTGALDFSFKVKDKGLYYIFYLYKEHWDPSAEYTFYVTPKEEETTAISYSYTIHSSEDVTIKRIQLEVRDPLYHDHCMWDADISSNPLIIPRSPLAPTGLTAVKNTDGTYTLSWDANDGVKKYYASAYYGSTNLDNWYTEYEKPKDGKYSVILDKLKDNGTYKFSVYGYDWNGDYVGEAARTFTVDQFPALGDVKVRIMVPTDRIPTLIDDIWICWKLPDEAYNTDGRFVKTTKNGNWYEATLETGTATRIEFVAISQNSWSGSYKCSFGDEVMSKEACFEMTSDLEGYGYWPLRKVDCDAADHDYRITALDVDNSKPGQAIFTITANQTAPSYVIFYKLHTASTWSRLIEWKGEEGLNQSYLFNNTTDREYDFQVKTYTETGPNSYTLSPIVTKTIKANTNRPTALNIHIAEDEQTVTFSWYKNGEDVVGFNLIVIDDYDKEWLVEKNITGNSFTHTFIVPQDYYWTLQACNASGEVLAEEKGLSFETGGPNLCPTMLNSAVNGKKATLAWTAPSVVPMCHYMIFDQYTDEIVASGDVTGNNGQYVAEYTLNEDTTITYYWHVYSESADKQQLSTSEYGGYFVLNGSKADPTPASKQYTLTLSAAPGGYVNSAANGKYDEGEKVVIHAYNYSYKWNFDKWSDGNTQQDRIVTMDKDITLQAIFETSYSFNLNISAGEGGSVNTEVNGPYNGGEKVTIIATADEEYEFVMWSDGDTEAEREITIIENTDLTAIFKAIPYYTLSISAGEGGTVNTAVNKSYKSGTKVKIKATPKEDYKFVQWSDGNKEAEREVVMTKNITLKASFEEIIYYTLTVEIVPEAGGTVQFDGATLSGMKKKAEEGQTIVLSAKPADGYVFQYYEDGTDEIKTADYSVIMNKNKTVTARFKKEEQGLESIQPSAVSIQKVLRDGQLYLIYNGTTYNVQGQEVK